MAQPRSTSKDRRFAPLSLYPGSLDEVLRNHIFLYRQPELDQKTLRKLQDRYSSVHLVIIDEYSVVSCAMLHWIDQRMREIWPTHRHLPFGGRDLILVGDLGQLSPVMPAALYTPDEELTNCNQRHGRILWFAMQHVYNHDRNDENLAAICAELHEKAALPNRTRDKVVPPSISLAIGVLVSLTPNLEQSAGLCNGTKAVVHGFMQRPGSNMPIVLAESVDKYIGPSFLENTPNIVPICPHALSWTVDSVGMRVRRTGVPLRLAYAMTIHKVQGLTCPSLVFDPAGIPTSAFAYVGLSRVRRRDHVALSHAIELKNSTAQSKTKRLLTSEWARLDAAHNVSQLQAQELVPRFQSIVDLENSQVAPSDHSSVQRPQYAHFFGAHSFTTR